MIKPMCDLASCGKELVKFGAILWGPRGKNRLAKKQHVCVECLSKVMHECSLPQEGVNITGGPILFGPTNKRGFAMGYDLTYGSYQRIQRLLFKKWPKKKK
jgi:hypothetical protein